MEPIKIHIMILPLLMILMAGSAIADGDVQAVREIATKKNGPSAKIVTSSSSSKASISYIFGNPDFQKRGAADRKNRYEITLSAPLQSDNKQADFASLDGLANSFNGSFSFTHIIKYNDAFQPAFKACDRPPQTADLQTLRAERDKIYKDEEIIREIAIARELKPEQVLPTGTDCRAVVADLEEAGDENLFSQSRSAYAIISRFKYVKSHQLSFYGLKATLGYEEFSFLNPDKFVSRDAFDDGDLKGSSSSNETPWSVSANYGQVRRGGWVWSGSFRYERKFEAAPTVTRCPAVDFSETFDCLAGASGEPSGENAYIASLGVKKFTSLFGLRNRAVALTANYDFGEDIISLDLPVYLISDKDGQLTGGFRVGWRSDTKDPIFGIFVGAPLSIF